MCLQVSSTVEQVPVGRSITVSTLVEGVRTEVRTTRKSLCVCLVVVTGVCPSKEIIRSVRVRITDTRNVPRFFYMTEDLNFSFVVLIIFIYKYSTFRQ